MNKITYGTIKKLKESEDLEVRVYDTKEAYNKDKFYIADKIKETQINDYLEGAVDKFENPYYVEVVDKSGNVLGHTSGVDENGNFLNESDEEKSVKLVKFDWEDGLKDFEYYKDPDDDIYAKNIKSGRLYFCTGDGDPEVEVDEKDFILTEAVVDKKDSVDIEELARRIMSNIEMYSELVDDDTDVFAGTQDSYAVEVFEQNLYDELLYSGLFQIEDLAQEMKSPSLDGKKLDELYSGIRDIVEDGKGFAETQDLVNYINAIVSDDAIKESVKTLKEMRAPNNNMYMEHLKKVLGDTYEEEELEDAFIIRGKEGDSFVGAVWAGKALNPQIYSRFRSEEQREAYIKDFLDKRAKRKEEVAKRREETRLTRDHDIKVGDIYYTSWGYDQTNIDFYEVVNVRGSRIDLKELKQNYVSMGQGAYDDVVEPIPGEYASDKIITISARADGSVTSISSFEYPTKWDGKPKYQTNPYSGH
jgi:hypothetical protein